MSPANIRPTSEFLIDIIPKAACVEIRKIRSVDSNIAPRTSWVIALLKVAISAVLELEHFHALCLDMGIFLAFPVRETVRIGIHRYISNFTFHLPHTLCPEWR